MKTRCRYFLILLLLAGLFSCRNGNEKAILGQWEFHDLKNEKKTIRFEKDGRFLINDKTPSSSDSFYMKYSYRPDSIPQRLDFLVCRKSDKTEAARQKGFVEWKGRDRFIYRTDQKELTSPIGDSAAITFDRLK
jgi:hypothetical protein